MLNVGGLWHGICDDLWGIEEAEVACRQLGFLGVGGVGGSGVGGGVTREGTFGDVSSFALDDVRCTGDEARLIDCQHKPVMTSNCR